MKSTIASLEQRVSDMEKKNAAVTEVSSPSNLLNPTAVSSIEENSNAPIQSTPKE